MTNVEILMTKKAQRPNVEWGISQFSAAVVRCLAFVIWISTFLRHLNFDIRHF